MIYFGFFMLGIVFEVILHPLLDSISQLITLWFEEKCSWLGLQINDTNLAIKEQNDRYHESTEPPAHAIGFEIPDSIDDEDEEE